MAYKDSESDFETAGIKAPDHYKPHGPIQEEPIRMMMRYLSYPAFEGYCIGNVIKYISRYESKGGLDDLNKAIAYIEFLKERYVDKVSTSASAHYSSPEFNIYTKP